MTGIWSRFSREHRWLLVSPWLVVACATTPNTKPIQSHPEPLEERDSDSLTDQPKPKGGRLPADVEPERYTLDLTIVPTKETFDGVVTIRARLAAPRRVIWLHGRGLKMREVLAKPLGEPDIEGDWQEHEDGFASVEFETPVPAGIVTLRFRYRARFSDKLDGLYRVQQGDESYAFTQFQPLSARQAFPCFDEPRFKTRFDVSIAAPRTDRVLANTHSVSVNVEGDKLFRHRFAGTKPLPTYLVAWAVGPLDVVDGPAIPPNAVRKTPIRLRGVSVRGRGGELDYALQRTPELLGYLEGYFGIPYPYQKLDVVAVPDFGAGAMENAGLVTFRDTLLLINEQTTPTRLRRYFTYVMAHELSHMWFGNLVTMEWWDDLWLNESFASWMEHRVVSALKPNFGSDVDLTEWTHRTMHSDTLSSARAVRQPIRSNHDIYNAFDAITYGKGAAVLQMVEGWIGEDSFRAGVRAYIKKHPFANATYDHLVSALDAASQKGARGILESFLTQSGVPMIHASLECNEAGPQVELTQSRYLPVGSSADSRRRWRVPVCVRYAVDGEVFERCTLLTSRKGTLAIAGSGAQKAECPQWIMPNSGAGYYRWVLPEPQLAALREHGVAQLSVPERMSLSDSVRASLRSGQLDGGQAIELLLKLSRDRHYAVATGSFGAVGEVVRHVVDAPHRAQLRERWARTIAPRFRRLGWVERPNEGDSVRLERQRVARFLALTTRTKSVRQEAVRRARRWLSARKPNKKNVRRQMAPDLVGVALAVAVQEKPAEVQAELIRELATTRDGAVRRHMLEAIGAAEAPDAAARARALTLDSSLRLSEIPVLIRAQFANGRSRKDAWTWLIEHYDALARRLSPSHTASLPRLAATGCTESDARTLSEFFGQHAAQLPGGPRSLRGAVERVRLCAALVNAQRERVHAWLDAGLDG